MPDGRTISCPRFPTFDINATNWADQGSVPYAGRPAMIWHSQAHECARRCRRAAFGIQGF